MRPSHSRCAALQHTCCAPCAKSLRLLALRSTPVGDSRLPQECDVAQGLWPCAPCTILLRKMVLRSIAPSGQCDVAQVCCFAAHLCSIGAFPFGGMRPQSHRCCFAAPVLLRAQVQGLQVLAPVRGRTGPLALCSIGAIPFGGLRRRKAPSGLCSFAPKGAKHLLVLEHMRRAIQGPSHVRRSLTPVLP